MTDSLINALGIVGVSFVSTLGAITVAMINTTRKHVKAVREQTENNHIDSPGKVANLRENIDKNQDTVVEKLDRIMIAQYDHTRKIDKLFTITSRHENSIDEITKEKP